MFWDELTVSHYSHITTDCSLLYSVKSSIWFLVLHSSDGTLHWDREEIEGQDTGGMLDTSWWKLCTCLGGDLVCSGGGVCACVCTHYKWCVFPAFFAFSIHQCRSLNGWRKPCSRPRSTCCPLITIVGSATLGRCPSTPASSKSLWPSVAPHLTLRLKTQRVR